MTDFVDYGCQSDWFFLALCQSVASQCAIEVTMNRARFYRRGYPLGLGPRSFGREFLDN